MRVRPLAGEDTGVSPVIGVILMIAITAILGAIVGGFALGIGAEAKEEPPSTRMSITFDGDEVTVTHQGGDRIENGGNVEVVATDATLQGSGWADGTEVTAGSSVTFTAKNGWSGGTVEVRWSDGDQSVVLGERDAPG